MPTFLTISQYLPGLLLAAGVGLLSFIAVLNVRSRFASRSSNTTPAHAMIDEIKARVKLAERISVVEAGEKRSESDGAAILETDQAARRLISQLETKSRTIERLIHQADERIGVLGRSVDECPVISISPTRLSPDHPESLRIEADATAASDESDREGRLHMHREGGEHQTNFAPANRVINLDSDSAASISKRAATTVRTRVNSPPLSVESLTARVYEHADRGESPQEIARRLDEHVGKVELILALRKQADRPAQIRA